ncbi:MFS transporter (plasmid) [Streptomyces sp. HUAS TT11]|uniref:MFS transporter n=1 Tax=Streptomyces sp. HUAS TT11 TaxID=3447508 RepID=UPI003F65B2C7
MTFRLIWLGRSLSLLGEYIQFLALPLWVQSVTGSPVAGLATFAVFYLPQLVCTPFAGVVADRFDRRRVVIAVDLAAFAVAASMALTTDAHRIGSVYAHLVVLQALGALGVPAFMSLLPDLVPDDRLLAANSLLNASAGVAITVGPLIGTTMLAHGSITAVIWVNALTYLIGAAAMCFQPSGRSPRPTTGPQRGGGPGQMRAGLKAVLTDTVLRTTIASEATWMLFCGAATQLVLMRIGAGGSGRAGLLGVGSGLGSLVMTTVLARTRRDVSPAGLFLLSVATTAPLMLVVALLTGGSGPAVLAVIAGLILGVQSYLVIIGPTMHCQRRPEPGLRGRVTAVRRTSRALWQVTGVALAALLTHWVSPPAILIVGGLLATVTATPWAWRAFRASVAPAPGSEAAVQVGAR